MGRREVAICGLGRDRRAGNAKERAGGASALALAILLAGCATEPAPPPPPRPADVRAQISFLLPASVPDRAGWATDIYAAFSALQIAPDAQAICATLAVTEQESTFRVDPPVPDLARIAREEIDRRADRIGVPAFAVRLALGITSPDGRSYADRLAAVRTEKELSAIFEDFIGIVPLGRRLFADWNPVRTGGPMQVSIAYAEQHVKARPYPYPLEGPVRHEVFTRRGGMYFGIAHLLDYPAPAYDAAIYRFADFNAGHHASRNAAFQNAVRVASGIPLDLDGDLLRRGDDADERPGATELAVRAIARTLDLDADDIHAMLEKGDGPGFERTVLYRRVFDRAESLERKPLPRALVPKIELKSPKFTRRLTTEWFATRVDARHRRCLERGAASPVAARLQWPGSAGAAASRAPAPPSP